MQAKLQTGHIYTLTYLAVVNTVDSVSPSLYISRLFAILRSAKPGIVYYIATDPRKHKRADTHCTTQCLLVVKSYFGE